MHNDPFRLLDYNLDGFIAKKAKQAYATDINFSGPASRTWLMSEDNWKNINFAGGIAMQAALLANARANTIAGMAAAMGLLPGVDFELDELPDYEGRWQSLPPGLDCPRPPELPAARPQANTAAPAGLQVTVGRGLILAQGPESAD